ncbi:BLUF domain-containing protein [Hymenobacter caeli]|uniref:BLUF domain-containing protein n=1 Tax=Hymenobacter caeli TaxID=2735894 RepID=A0ABX2FV03_9BACT|nr:BLUF domain-containing protein [Hymenobacter caeli]NRT20658.1 hypothetical protein [Hymenobacter caeli]
MEQLTPLTEAERRRAVAYVIALTANTPIAPQRYERQLLARYQQGELTVDQVLESLDASIYQVLYRSRTAEPWSVTQLQALLNKSRHYNAAHGITGLLLYSDGCFVQVLEGPENAVRTLYANIQQDPRHTQLLTIREGLGPRRYFADWSMDFGYVEKQEVEQALDLLYTESTQALVSKDPYLCALLRAFAVEEEATI